jgi:hypothetical protein
MVISIGPLLGTNAGIVGSGVLYVVGAEAV